MRCVNVYKRLRWTTSRRASPRATVRRDRCQQRRSARCTAAGSCRKPHCRIHCSFVDSFICAGHNVHKAWYNWFTCCTVPRSASVCAHAPCRVCARNSATCRRVHVDMSCQVHGKCNKHTHMLMCTLRGGEVVVRIWS